MNTTASSSRLSAQTFRDALVHAVARIMDRAAAPTVAVRPRREVRQLCAWDDAMLKDIGLTRSDVVGALSEPLSRDPSAVLAARFESRRGRARCSPQATGAEDRL